MRHNVLILFFVVLMACPSGVGQLSTFTSKPIEVAQGAPTPKASLIPVEATTAPSTAGSAVTGQGLSGSQGVSQLELLPVTTLTITEPQIYTDPELDFSLNYDSSWQLETHSGTNLNDGSGRTILLEKESYQFKLQLQRKPEIVGECSGILTQADRPRYWKYPLGQLEVWRAKAETDWVNSFHHDQVSFIDIITPTELRDEADARGEIGLFSCSPQINEYVLNISYQLPVSLEDLKAGRFSPERLAEMDYILTSLALK